MLLEPSLEVLKASGREPQVRVDFRDHIPRLVELFGCPAERDQLGGLGQSVAEGLSWRPCQGGCVCVASGELPRQRQGPVARAVVNEQQAIRRARLAADRVEQRA